MANIDPVAHIKVDKNDTQSNNKVQFGNEYFSNLLNRLRSGEPIMGNMLNGSQPIQNSFLQ